MSNLKPITIGPRTSVGLPRFGLSNIPAKVDTGADSSSIWASNIRENNGKLSYTLFGPSSPYYNGKEITTKDFRISSVKNSFGYSEFRYKVNIKTVIEGKAINILYTLANRGNNSHPILIGRKTLHGRFVVDVSHSKKKHYEVLVMKPGPLKIDGKYDQFFNRLEAESGNMKFSFSSYDDLKFIFKGRQLNVRLNNLKRDVADFDMVYFFVPSAEREFEAALALYLKRNGVLTIDKSTVEYNRPLNKVYQYVQLNLCGARLPSAVAMNSKAMADSYDFIVKNIGLPFVVKNVSSHHGRDNHLIKTKAQFTKLFDQIKRGNYVAQKYIQNEGDYRLMIYGKQINLVIKRVAKRGSHLNNVNTEDTSTLVKESFIPTSVRRIAIKAADAMQIEIAGVDMVKDKESGLWYCLEVNENPRLATGVFLTEKQAALIEYFQKRLHKI
jgi:glutathione synthase/RimK-type ligase-like ATP-grasp enzyme